MPEEWVRKPRTWVRQEFFVGVDRRRNIPKILIRGDKGEAGEKWYHRS